jgi:hypothetical protein
MLEIKVNDKEYKLEYTFRAAEDKSTVQNMFNVLSGSYLIKQVNNAKTENDVAMAMINGTSERVADIPSIVKNAFYSGLLENHEEITKEEAYEIMKAYMKENKINFRKLFDDIKTCMEDDGFFELSGLIAMLETMNQTEEKKKAPKTPQDHKKKSTGTK